MYYVTKGNEIILADNNYQNLVNTTKIMNISQDAIQKTEKEIVNFEGKYYFTDDEELIKKQREQLNMVTLTAADVERAIYKAKGLDFEDIIELVKDNPVIDVKALKIELKANNFYRGNPYVSQIGMLLGYSSDDLDYLFKHKELPVKGKENDLV